MTGRTAKLRRTMEVEPRLLPNHCTGRKIGPSAEVFEEFRGVGTGRSATEAHLSCKKRSPKATNTSGREALNCSTETQNRFL
jgi:hypothetical protein